MRKGQFECYFFRKFTYNTENELDDIDKCIYEYIYKCEKDMF